MSRTAVIRGRFDPVTAEDVAFAVRLRREKQYEKIVFVPVAEGSLPRETRQDLLQAALKPYRRFCTGKEPQGTDVYTSGAEEKEAAVRQGNYALAARGIRKLLAAEGLYFEDLVDACCNPHRAAHSRAVADLCRQLAEAHGLDGDLAWWAGMLHDITKGRSEEWGRRILERYEPEALQYAPPVWHSFTAPVWLKQNLGITDHELLAAIRNHTLGGSQTPLAMILYIADKTEPTRGYDSTGEIALSMKDLAAGFALVKQEAAEWLKKGGANG